ncbi:MAG: hypothetical protein FWG68_03825 [Defluviitaleaceae bacterium]|nr:hypothetical protein [Defluviitaleaceae bacterium]
MAKAKWGVTTCNLVGLDSETMATTFAEMDKVFATYPQLVGQLAAIQSVDSEVIGENAFMATDGETLYINSDFYATENIETLTLERKTYVQRGYFPIGTENIASTAVHELGHLLEIALIRAKIPIHEQEEFWNNCTYAEKLVDSAMNEVSLSNTEILRGFRNYETDLNNVADSFLVKIFNGLGTKTKSDIIRHSISKYANVSPSETLAEAFSDVWFNGNNANSLSRAIMQKYLSASR